MAEVKSIKYRKPIVEYILSSLYAFGYTLLFDLFGVAFMVNTLHPIFVMIMSVAVLVPVSLLLYVNGKKSAEKDFKRVNTNYMNNIGRYSVNKVNPLKSLLHMSFFIGIPMVLILVGQALPGAYIQAFVSLFFVQSMTFFTALGVYNYLVLSWWSVLAVFVHLLCTAGVFIVTYIVTIVRLNNNALDIANEIRSVGK